MPQKDIKQYIKNNQIHDALLIDFIDRELYSVAIKEIPRVIHAYELKIFALQQLERVIDVVVEENKVIAASIQHKDQETL